MDREVFTTSIFCWKFQPYRFNSLQSYIFLTYFTFDVFPHCDIWFVKTAKPSTTLGEPSLPLYGRLNCYNHSFLNETIPKERKSIWSLRQPSVAGKKTTLLIVAGKGRIPLLMAVVQVFRKSLVTLNRYLIFHSILDTLDRMQFLSHTCHTLCYFYYKPGDKTWMRKGQDCDYEKRNISVAF